MLGVFVSIFLGWPAILVSVVLAVMGLARYSHRLLVAAAVVALPFSWYLSGFPIVRSPIFLLPLLLFGSGYFMYRGREMVAWLLAIPFFLAILLLLFALLSGAA